MDIDVKQLQKEINGVEFKSKLNDELLVEKSLFQDIFNKSTALNSELKETFNKTQKYITLLTYLDNQFAQYSDENFKYDQEQVKPLFTNSLPQSTPSFKEYKDKYKLSKSEALKAIKRALTYTKDLYSDFLSLSESLEDYFSSVENITLIES